MALDFKKITEVTLQDAVTENTNVYIEENGEIKRVSASEIGGSGVSSWNDLTDKPFGEEDCIEILVEEQTISCNNENDFNGITLYMSNESPFSFTVNDGETYTIIWDGIEYICDFTQINAYIGNSNHLGISSDDDMPFSIMFNPDDLNQFMINAESSGNHTISISNRKTIIHQINSKYVDINWNNLTNKPFYEEIDYSLTWDGNIEGRTVCMDYFYKISDLLPTLDELSNGITIKLKDRQPVLGELYEISSDFAYLTIYGDCYIAIAYKDNAESEGGYEVPEKGIYFINNQYIGYVESLTINGYDGFSKTTIKHLDSKYIKDMYHETIEKTPIIEDCSFEFKASSYSYSQYTDSSYSPVVGKLYDVVFNGVLYENLVCFDDYDEPTIGCPYSDLTNEDKSYPFRIFYSKDSYNLFGLYMPPQDENTVYTFSVYAHETVTHQIDEKYIPEMSSVILKSSTEGSTKKFRITVDDSGNLTAVEI